MGDRVYDKGGEVAERERCFVGRGAEGGGWRREWAYGLFFGGDLSPKKWTGG